MADKSFGVKELNLLNASGTPTVTSPNNLNLNANTVAISTSCTIGNNLTVTSTTNSANLNVTGIGTLTRGFATDLSVSGISTISQPSNANPHSLWDVVNNSSSAYRFTGPGQDGAEDNPNIYLVRGQRYIFKVNASGHPFQLRVANGGAAYSDGVTNNGAQTGNVVINVQHDAPAQLYYQCTSHGSMVGNIYIIGGPQVISGVVTATSFVGDGSALTNLPAGTSDKIEEGNTKIEITDTGTGSISFEIDGSEKLNMGSYAQFNQTVYVNDTVQIGGQLQVSDAILHLNNSPCRIRFPENNVIELKTDNTVAVRVDQNQNMNVAGIVTATTFVGNLTGNVTGTASANAVLTGSTNNQLVTVTGANAITGESGLTFDGSTLNLTSASGDARVTLIGTEGNDARLSLVSDDGDDHIDQYNLRVDASDNSFFIDQFESGSFIQRFRIANGGKIVMGNSTTSTTQLDIRFTDTTAYSATSNHVNGLKIFNDSNTDNGFAGIELAATDGDDYYGSTLLKSIADGTNYSNDFVIQTRHSGNYAERLRIDSTGAVTIPNQPCFDVSKGNGTTSATNPIVYNTVHVNIGSHYDTSNGRFTAPVTGRYLFYFGAIKNNSSSVARLRLRRDGTTYMNSGRELRIDDGAGNYGENGSMTMIVSLNANQYVQVVCTAGNIYSGDEYVHFGGYLLS